MTGSRRILTLGGVALYGVLGLALAGPSCGSSSSGSPDGGATAGSGGHAGSHADAGGSNAGAGGHAGTGVVDTSGTPVQLCNKLVSTICMRSKSCNVLANPATFDETKCENVFNTEIGCDRAGGTSFPDCLTDVTTVTCGGLFSQTDGLVLPPSCDDAVNMIPLSTAQMKCSELALADCLNLAMCLGLTSADPTFQDQIQQCQSADFANAGCGLAVGVGDTFDQCKLQITNASCTGDADGGADDGGSSLSACDNAITYVN